jgi:NTE family protein
MIVGTSIGALVGGADASGLGPYTLKKRVEEFLESATYRESALRTIREIQASKKLTLAQKIQAFFKDQFFLAQAMFRAGMLHNEDFQAMIDFFLPDIQIEETRVDFRAVATDLVSGEAVVFSRGSLRKAVMASCAVPGAVAPLLDNEMVLTDGGVAHMVPTMEARQEGADYVVAVSVIGDLHSEETFSSAMDVYVRAANITSFHLEKSLLEKADVVIRPKVGDLHWTDFGAAKDLVEAGAIATLDKINILRREVPLLKRWKGTKNSTGAPMEAKVEDTAHPETPSEKREHSF